MSSEAVCVYKINMENRKLEKKRNIFKKTNSWTDNVSYREDV